MGGAAAQPLLDVEKAVFSSTNLSRKQFNVAPVTLDTVLSDLARKHSEEMLSSSYFSHHSPNEMCRTLRDRLKHCNWFCLSSAENLYKCEGAARSELADEAVDSWMHSPSHRQKLMNSRFNRVGIGLAGRGETYLFTQVFSIGS